MGNWCVSVTLRNKLEFSIKECLEHQQTNKSPSFSANTSVRYVFLHVSKASSKKSSFLKALCENIRYIINTIAKENPKECALQLEAVMKECGLPEYVGLHLQRRNCCLEDATIILQELTITDSNAPFYCFLNPALQIKLLKLLSRSKNTDLQQLFFEFLNQTKHLNLDEDKMCQIIQKCFVNSLQNFKIKQGNDRDKVLKNYLNFNRINGTSYVKKHFILQQTLEDIMLGVMQKCKLRNMILAIPDIEAAQSSADIYQKHINKILLDTFTMESLNKIINNICGGSLPLMVDTRTILGVIQTILDAVEISLDDSDETVFGKIADSSEFWIGILTSEGKMVKKMKQHTKVKRIETTIRNTIHAINKQSINSRFLSLLLARMDESKNILFFMIDNTSKLNDTLSGLQKMIFDYESNLRLFCSTFGKLKVVQNKTLRFILRKSLHHIKELGEDLLHGRIIANELSTEISEIRMVQDIAELCKHFENVVSARVFWNETWKFLEQKEAVLKKIENYIGYDVYDELSLSFLNTIESIKIAAKVFKFDKHDSIYFDTVHKFEFLLKENASGATFKEIIPVLQKIDSVDRIISEDIKNILQATKQSSALLEFLQEVVDDDLRNLIDAVEEHSEQKFLEKMDEFFELLQKQIDNTGSNSIQEKIYICRNSLHSLKAFYRNVANRGERTVEVIENIIRKGTFHFSLKSRTCEVVVQYAQVKKKYKHSIADLSDLRSRAVLLMNAEDKNTN
ncbi:unnamed protein product [Mytilus coruscus]|uniref:Uncharacterized protein n=1 Tax=Mytilus coruscus TaxID=42192 RepID=A0A6J8AQT6_MYTCO|nr:unnamed protein product [Mytilus coruscus]